MPVAADIYYHLHQGSVEKGKNAVVLIHGAGGNHLYWPPQVRRMPGFWVYALDLPGHGKSGGVGQQSIAAYAREIVAWMEAVGLSSAVLAGHSMGSAVALSLVLDYPDLVQGLVLVGAGARMRVNPILLEDFSSPATFLSAVDKTLAWSFSEHTPARLVELAGKRMAETRQGVLFGDFQACATFDVTCDLEKIRQPVLVICGEQDKMTPCRYAQFLVDHLSHGRLRIVPQAGHMVMLEKPEIVSDELLSFLTRIP